MVSSCPPTLFLVVFSLGCAPSEEPAPTGQDPVGEVTAWVDRLHAGTVEGFASAGGAGVAASWDASSWHWTSQAEPELLSLTESPVTAAARTSEGLWVVLEDSLFLFDV